MDPKTVISLFDTEFSLIGGIRKAESEEELLRAVSEAPVSVKRLSEKIMYAPEIFGGDVIPPPLSEAKLKRVREYLESIAELTNAYILTGAIAHAPAKTTEVFKLNPWEILADPRPYHLAVKPNDPEMVPIAFNYHGQKFIGWQKRGVLPLLFDWNIDEKYGMLLPKFKPRSSPSVPPPIPNSPTAHVPTSGPSWTPDLPASTNKPKNRIFFDDFRPDYQTNNGEWWTGNTPQHSARFEMGKYHLEGKTANIQVLANKRFSFYRPFRVAAFIQVHPHRAKTSSGGGSSSGGGIVIGNKHEEKFISFGINGQKRFVVFATSNVKDLQGPFFWDLTKEMKKDGQVNRIEISYDNYLMSFIINHSIVKQIVISHFEVEHIGLFCSKGVETASLAISTVYAE